MRAYVCVSYEIDKILSTHRKVQKFTLHRNLDKKSWNV